MRLLDGGALGGEAEPVRLGGRVEERGGGQARGDDAADLVLVAGGGYAMSGVVW